MIPSRSCLTQTTLDKEKKVLEYYVIAGGWGILLASGKLEPGLPVFPVYPFTLHLLYSLTSDQCPSFANLET